MKALPWLAVAIGGILLGAWGRGQLDRERAAADKATIASHQQAIDDLLAREAKVDTQLVTRDSIRVLRRIDWDSVKALARAWSTHDTTPGRVDTVTIERVVAVAEDAIQACEATLSTCEDQVATLRSRVVAESTAYRALSRELARVRIRSRFGCTIGVAATAHGFKPGGSCGWRIF